MESLFVQLWEGWPDRPSVGECGPLLCRKELGTGFSLASLSSIPGLQAPAILSSFAQDNWKLWVRSWEACHRGQLPGPRAGRVQRREDVQGPGQAAH